MPFQKITYQIIKPNPNDEFYADWQNCRVQLSHLSRSDTNGIFKMNIFVHDTEIESFHLKKQFIKKDLIQLFGKNCPTFGVLPQSPEKPFHVTIEIGIINSSDVKINYRKYGEFLYTVVEINGFKELWANGLENIYTYPDTESYSRYAFDLVQQILRRENMTFDNIVRQWNYVANILGNEHDDKSHEQNYQTFNKVRQEYYSRYRSVPDFPAATGIGMNFNAVAIDFCAISTNDDLLIYSINNPKQIKPYAYDQQVLSESSFGGIVQKTPPQFERAKLIEKSESSRLFISGTASIIGQVTTGIGNIELQTITTIENISTLIEKANLLHKNPQFNVYSLNKCSFIRVYVKHFEDIPVVKSICVNYFGDTPANYLRTDICREGLLVEIEAELNLTD